MLIKLLPTILMQSLGEDYCSIRIRHMHSNEYQALFHFPPFLSMKDLGIRLIFNYLATPLQLLTVIIISGTYVLLTTQQNQQWMWFIINQFR